MKDSFGREIVVGDCILTFENNCGTGFCVYCVIEITPKRAYVDSYEPNEYSYSKKPKRFTRRYIQRCIKVDESYLEAFHTTERYAELYGFLPQDHPLMNDRFSVDFGGVRWRQHPYYTKEQVNELERLC